MRIVFRLYLHAFSCAKVWKSDRNHSEEGRFVESFCLLLRLQNVTQVAFLTRGFNILTLQNEHCLRNPRTASLLLAVPLGGSRR